MRPSSGMSTVQPRVRETAASFNLLALEQGGLLTQENGDSLVSGYLRFARYEFEQNREEA